MTRTRILSTVALALAASVSLSSRALAAQCGSSAAGYEGWKQQFAGEARAKGISPNTIAALMATNYAQATINADRGQRSFQLTLEQFLAKRGAPAIVAKGRKLKQSQGALFASIQQRYGVPPGPLLAIWGMETGFGTQRGNQNMLASIATLAYDCRRSELFKAELMDILRVIERGDIAAQDLRGSWAGELGQTQFLPTHYFNYAVDYDGDGHRNLLRSAPDVIGSTANYIATGLKWRRGEPWLQEVRVPHNLPWEQTDLSTKHPRSKWAAWGVTYPDGKPLPNDDLPASVLLPMGRTGPAFMAYPNFAAYTEWNNSLIYATTAGYLATRIAGAAPMRQPAQPVAQLQFAEIKELQQLLARAGHNVGKIDGVLGQQSRIAVKAMQQKYGMPADSWPTAELLARMRGPGAQAQPAGALMPQAR